MDFAHENDLELLNKLDEYISKVELVRLIPLERTIVAKEKKRYALRMVKVRFILG